MQVSLHSLTSLSWVTALLVQREARLTTWTIPFTGISRYRKLKDLNEGTFGIVLLAMDVRSKEQVRPSTWWPLMGKVMYLLSRDRVWGQQGVLSPGYLSQVAIKFLERGAGVNKSVLREILNHRLCVVHPNIVQFREIFLTPVHLAIVMEFAAGGDMFEYVIKHKMPQHGQGLVEGLCSRLLSAAHHSSGLLSRAWHCQQVPFCSLFTSNCLGSQPLSCGLIVLTLLCNVHLLSIGIQHDMQASST